MRSLSLLKPEILTQLKSTLKPRLEWLKGGIYPDFVAVDSYYKLTS
jgi:hypothetical protein